MPSGLEILQETIQACDTMVDGLDSSEGAREERKLAVAEIAETLKDLSPSFFFKTTPSVPATRACQRDVATLNDLFDETDWSGFPNALDKLQKAVKVLAEKASMRGTVLT